MDLSIVFGMFTRGYIPICLMIKAHIQSKIWNHDKPVQYIAYFFGAPNTIKYHRFPAFHRRFCVGGSGGVRCNQDGD